MECASSIYLSGLSLCICSTFAVYDEVPLARFTIDTDQQFDRNLDELVNMTGGTKADVLRKALATYKYLKTENQDSQNKVSITNKDNVVMKGVILP